MCAWDSDATGGVGYDHADAWVEPGAFLAAPTRGEKTPMLSTPLSALQMLLVVRQAATTGRWSAGRRDLDAAGRRATSR